MTIMRVFLPGQCCRCFLLALLLTTLFSSAYGQGFRVTGQITDGKTKDTLTGVTVVLRFAGNDSFVQAASTNGAGRFVFADVAPASYRIEWSYLGYTTRSMVLGITGNLSLDTLTMVQDSKMLKEVVVEDEVIGVVQKGDTTEYRADAYKTNPDADGTDLVKKMPGIVTEDGKLKAQGEEVKKVTVDGQEFFGEDAMLALKNLPAEVIDKVQVFDQLSDQAQFTGFDDGNTTKTINIVTKSGKANGQFGKVYAGYGTDNRYNAGFNTNLFNGKQRITLIGMSNNINQQNFNNEDLLGALATQQAQGQQGRGGRGPGRQGGNANDPSNFLVGEQNGINSAHSLGINYIDQWGKKLKVSGSYFLNSLENRSQQTIERNYFLNESGNQVYNSENSQRSGNINHRLNFRFEYTLDSFNSIIYTPRLSVQGNRASPNGFAVTRIGGDILNTSLSNGFNDRSGFTLNQNLLFRHRFYKEGRTFSLGIEQGLSRKTAFSSLFAQNLYVTEFGDSLDVVDQQGNSDGLESSMGLRIMYTEPLGKTTQLIFSYNPSRNRQFSENNVYAFNSLTGTYSDFDSLLSSDITSRTEVHSGGAGTRIRLKSTTLSFHANYQESHLEADQALPQFFAVDRRFRAFLPTAFVRHQFSKTEQLRAFYRTSTNLPGANQLQESLDNSNPLLFSQGNSELQQSYSHRLGSRYNRTNTVKERTLFVSASALFTQNYVANSSFLAQTDTTVHGVFLPQGTQLNRPVNLDGYWNLSGFVSYGMKLKKYKSNLNLNINLRYSEVPGMINDRLNLAKASGLNLSAVLGSNVSQKLDFTISYAVDLNRVRNTLQPELNNDYFFHAGTASVNWMPKGGWVFNTQGTYMSFIGLGDAFSSDYMIWNAAVGYKFLKDKKGEFRLTVFDILGQNNSLSRTVTEVYVQDMRNVVLERYAMLSFIYTFRNFSAKTATK